MTDPLDGLSKNETIKARSQHLRGTIKEELQLDAPVFTEEAAQILKFHGVYQQDDRDRRKEARAQGLGKAYQMMVRTRVPGGVVSPEGYLAHDDIATRWGNGTLRVTTRQDFQLHGVLKGDLHAAIHAINDALMTTLGGCGVLPSIASSRCTKHAGPSAAAPMQLALPYSNRFTGRRPVGWRKSAKHPLRRSGSMVS